MDQSGAIGLEQTRRENEREHLAAEGRRDRARLDAEARAIDARQEVELLSERVKAENTASPARLERLFITQALPALAQTLATSTRDMRFNVLQTAGPGSSTATPVGFLLAQIMELLDQRLTRAQASAPDPSASQSGARGKGHICSAQCEDHEPPF